MRVPIISSGAVATLENIRLLKGLEKDDVDGVIDGRALYAGTLTVRGALEAAERKSIS